MKFHLPINLGEGRCILGLTFVLALYGMFCGLCQIFEQDDFVPPRSEYGMELRQVAPVEVPPFCPRKLEVTNEVAFIPESRKSSRRSSLLMPKHYRKLIDIYSNKYHLPPELVIAVISRESDFDPKAVAPDGGQGLMQLMPEVVAEQKCRDPFDPEQNIQAGCAHLAGLLGKFSDKLALNDRLAFALASYNGGWGHVIDARKLAVELKLNPDKWFGEVEEALLFLKYRSYYRRYKHGRCRSDMVVNYVSSVLNLYELELKNSEK